MISDHMRLSTMSSEEKRALLAGLLDRKEDRPEVAPLSFPQERLWFLDQLDPGAPTYNIPTSIPFAGRLDQAALEAALQDIVDRHEVLRTTFSRQGHEPVQLVWPHLDVQLDVHDLRSLTRSPRQREADRIATEEAFHPFDLTRAPLMRAVLLRLRETESLLLVTMHHIVSDGWSLEVFTRELRALYDALSAGRTVALPPPDIQYRDFARRQRAQLQSDVVEWHLDYWRRELADAPEVLALPTDHRRPTLRSPKGFVQPFSVPNEVADGLRRLAKSEGATLFMTLLAAFKVFLYRHTGQTDLVVGAPVANRNSPDLESLIGFFVNTLILRTDASGDPTFREYLGRVRDVALGAYAHQELPVERIVEDLQPERDLSRNPIFQVAFTFQNVAGPGPGTPDGRGELPPSESRSSKFDMTLGLGETGDGGVTGALEGSADLFSTSTVTRLARRFQTLLRAVVDEPDRPISSLRTMPPAESKQVLVDWNRTAAAFPELCFHQLFERQVDRTPRACAAEFGDEALSYRELDQRSNQLAWHLQRLGAGPETGVAICVERGLDLAVTVLGVMKSGAAYLPLDPKAPHQRTAFMCDDAGVGIVVTQAHLAEPFGSGQRPVVRLDTDAPAIDWEPTDRPAPPLSPENLAYIIYTSGSTGTPKGILVPHRGLANMGTAEVREFRTGPGDRVLQVAPLIFDVSIWEMAMTWLAGATLVFATEEEIVSGSVLNERGITVASFTPSLLATLDPAAYPALRTAITVGEACTNRVMEEWAPGRRLINVYGPTETTGHCSVQDLRADGELTIGRPIQNVSLYVLNDALEPVPPGVAGELHVSSPGTTRGYVNRPGLTAERFVPDPFTSQPGGRLYKTGDVVRYKADGRIEFLGRADHQVKVRGFRIELGEIESVLAALPGVAEVVVVVREDRPGEKRLVAYVVAEAGGSVDTEDLRRALRQRLPSYMVPSHVVGLDRLPLNANRKIDRRALPAPDAAPGPNDEPQAHAMTDTESVVAGIWADVLGTTPGPADNFFDLGGHSLLATQVLTRLTNALHVEIPMRALFLGPTIVDLAKVIDEALAAGASFDGSTIGRIARRSRPVDTEALERADDGPPREHTGAPAPVAGGR